MKRDTENFIKGLETYLQRIFTTYTKDKLEVVRILNEFKQKIIIIIQ